MEQIKAIVDIQVNNLAKMLEGRKLSIEISEKARELLAKEGFDPVYGARPLKRVIQNQIQNVLALQLLEGKIKEGDKVLVDVTGPEGRKLSFETAS
jgi:ATP-dependent Clp protease ATP-binding subunit ClpB